MKIESSSYRIKDDFGLLFEVKPLIEIPNNVATEEISSFFSRYRIISAFKDINPIDKRKEILASSTPSYQQQPRPAEFLPIQRLVYIVKEMMQSPFSMDSFLQYMNSHKDFDGYTSDDKKHMWKSVHTHLTKKKLIELANPGAQKTQYKYRYIGKDKDTDNKIEDLKEGKTVTL